MKRRVNTAPFSIQETPASLKTPYRRRAVLVLRREAGPFGQPLFAHPDLPVGMQAGAAGCRNGREPRPMQKPRIGNAAVGMEPPIGRDHFLPGSFAFGEHGRIGKLRAVELVLVEVDDDLIAILDKAMGPPSAASGPTWPITRPDRTAGEAGICHQRDDDVALAAKRGDAATLGPAFRAFRAHRSARRSAR